MAESGLQAPNIPALPPPPTQPGPAQQVQQPTQHMQQVQQVIHINWSHFKPEFSGKSEEDAEAHFFLTNNWMNTHHFLEDIKVRRFCLTLVGEDRQWYQSLEPINVYWHGLQNLF